MESGLKNAWIVAGVKSGLGLLFVGALVAIRMVTATPANEDPSPGLSGDAVSASRTTPEPPPTAKRQATESEPSLVERAASSLRERVTNGSSGSSGGDRMVSCRIRGRVQFMTADDCAVRGGSATRLGDDR